MRSKTALLVRQAPPVLLALPVSPALKALRDLQAFVALPEPKVTLEIPALSAPKASRATQVQLAQLDLKALLVLKVTQAQPERPAQPARSKDQPVLLDPKVSKVTPGLRGR